MQLAKPTRLLPLFPFLPILLATCVAVPLGSALADGPSLPNPLKAFEPTSATAKPAAQAPPRDLKAKHEELTQQLNDAEKALADLQKASPGAVLDHLKREVELLKDLQVVYTQFETMQERRTAL